MKTKEEIFKLIYDWSEDMGECFYDRFCHTNVKDLNWAFFLLGKGYKDHANKIIDEVVKGETCIDMNILYDIKPTDEDDSLSQVEYMNNWTYNVRLMAEFLSLTPTYQVKFDNFIKLQ